MSPDPPPLNASAAVERIREIIVGRHLERLEQRVARLETSESPGTASPALDERILMSEARIEALQHSVSRLTDNTRDELERRSYLQREEIQRLAQQIQQVAATRPREPQSAAAFLQLEQRLGNWLTNWKTSIQQHLEARDVHFSGGLQNELTSLRNTIDYRFSELESRLPDGNALEARFKRIAEAARAFADSVSELPPIPNADGNPP